MKNIIILILIAFTFTKAEVQIVASEACKIEFISKSDIKKLFTLKKKAINNELIVVLDTSDKELYKQFIRRYLKKSLRKIKTYWIRMLFTGKKIAPKKLSSNQLSSLEDKGICHLSYVQATINKPKEWKIIDVK
jgi:hypothetical protein